MASNEMLENLIPLVNSLQDVLSVASSADGAALDLPQICVVGNQSAGKSSVLEALVGRDFLPRGAGIVTRRPLVLQLVRSSDDAADHAEFAHRRGERFYDFDAVRAEIAAETERVAGSSKAVSSVPITLRIYSPFVVDLTLVDLPGLTKVPVDGQPADIEEQVRSMVLSFAANPHSLILCVCAANADLATSDALKLAQEVDADGERTIGVLTKLDLMDEGTDARAVLDNAVVPLRRGYVAVVNRGQLAIDRRADIVAALANEQRFFTQHPAYRDIADRLGTSFLQRNLNKVLTEHIAHVLPDLRYKLRRQVDHLDAQLERLTFEFDYDDPDWKAKAVVQFAIDFAQRFRAELLGNSDVHLSYDVFSTGAQICDLFHHTYEDWLFQTEFTHEDVMKREIGYAIQNILGVRTGLFTPDKAFDLIIRTQIRKLEEPTLQILDSTGDYMRLALRNAASELTRFPVLQNTIDHRGNSAMYSCGEHCREQLKNLLEYEFGYINTRHEDFVGFNYAEQKAYSRVLKRRNPGMESTCKGWLALQRRRYWFILTPDSLSWFADETMNERKYMIPVDENIRFQDMLKDNRFVLYYQDSKRNIHLDKRRLDLQAPTFADLDNWKRYLIQVGICSDSPDLTMPLEGQPQTISEEILATNDPWLERQIESIWILVDSYMRIVCKTLQDIVPKCIVRLLIKETVYFMEKKMIADLSRCANIDDFLEENQAEVAKKESLVRSRGACVAALEAVDKIPVPSAAPTTDRQPKQSSNRASTWMTAKPSLAPKPKTVIAETNGARSPPDPKPSAPPRKPSPAAAAPFSRSRSQHDIRKAIDKHKTSDQPTAWHV